MLLRLLVALALGAGSHLAAADIWGRWTGTMETAGIRIPVYLILAQRDGQITGYVATGTGGIHAIQELNLQGDELRFAIRDNVGPFASFRLTLSHGTLVGESRVADQVSKVTLSTREYDAGFGDGVFLVGGGVSRPQLIHRVQPEYTEEALAAKYQGTVILYVEIDPTGAATHIRVQRGLGMGLDEKAVEAVKQWMFKPGEKDGKPVTVAATIEVNFHL